MAASDVSSPSTASAIVADAKAEIAALRQQVEQLIAEHVTPAMNDAANRANHAAKKVGDCAREQTAAMSNQVREQPLLAVGIAVGIGYLIGRLTR